MSEMNNQKASSSSSSSKKKETAMRMSKNIVEDGPVEKKLKEETNAVTDEDGQVEDKTKSFSDLPTEMVMKILKNLNVKDLLACRRVNRQFTRVSSEILQSNAGIEFGFECYKRKDKFGINKKNKSSFRNLVKCFDDFPNFPCSRLRFEQVQKLFFEHEDWIKLIENHGERIKCLILGTKRITENSKFVELTEGLRHLLLNQLPNLTQLGLKFSHASISSNIQLFPETATTSTSNSKPVRLPHLQVLYLDESSFTKQSNIVTDILRAAVNLRRIELFPGRHGEKEPIKNVQLLQRMGKLHLLQQALVEVSLQLLSRLKENGTTDLDFKLKELELNIKGIKTIKAAPTDATIFLSTLFESSKDTLREIKMGPLGFMTDPKLPTFSKLVRLFVTRGQIPLLPPKTISLDCFPVLQSLDLDMPWATAFPEKDSVLVIPSLKNLEVPGKMMKGKCIVQISEMCPNLKSLKIAERWNYWDHPILNFPEVGKAIWTHLIKLEFLKVRVNPYRHADYSIDSCITGISKQDSERLYNLEGSHVKTPKRNNISILNLKELRSFTMDFGSADSLAITRVSEEYALNLMDNLTYKINRPARAKVSIPVSSPLLSPVSSLFSSLWSDDDDDL